MMTQARLQERMIVTVREAAKRSESQMCWAALAGAVCGVMLTALVIWAQWLPHWEPKTIVFACVLGCMAMAMALNGLRAEPTLRCPECGVQWTRRSILNAMHCSCCAQYLAMRIDPKYKLELLRKIQDEPK
jgi:hypothetical protein